MRKFDLVVLGTGPSGSRVAKGCAEAGWNVAIVESREFGGTCALRGCNPKKVLVRAAELVDWSRRAEGHLIRSTSPRIDWSELIAFKNTFTDPVKEKSEASFQKRGVATFQGQGIFLDTNTIAVSDHKLQADHFVIAVGSRPRSLSVPGEDLVTTSDEFLDLPSLPRRILFVGGGYISFEFAHVARRCDRDVTIITQGDRPLRAFDEDIVAKLVDHTREIGIEFCAQTKLVSIGRRGESLEVSIEGVDGRRTIEMDLVVHGAGRIPNLDGMNLSNAEIESSERGVRVNEFLQSTSNPNVFACGDCADSGEMALTPPANQQGRTIVQNLVAGELKHLPDYGIVPAAVFTIPSLASIGLTESEARSQHMDIDVRTGDMSDWGSVRKVCGSAASFKLLVDNATDRIIGAHLFGPHAAETINLFALAMKFGLTATDIKSTLFTFPTFSADVRSMI
ncbi:MAG: NAD(P)/FAD-dependent oxidoreductase [Planctomycetota bacterium]